MSVKKQGQLFSPLGNFFIQHRKVLYKKIQILKKHKKFLLTAEMIKNLRLEAQKSKIKEKMQ